MTAPSFDSTHAVRFDLGSGSVRAAGQDEQLVLLPAAALANLLLYASADAGVALGRALGESIGRRVAARIRSTEPSVEQFATQLAGEAALAGVGVLGLERWGRALVVIVEQSPLAAPLLAPLIGAALEAASGRKNVSSVLLAHDDGASRVLIASERGIERVRAWMMAGTPWGDALVKLHGGGS
jgi:hypothetical protein